MLGSLWLLITVFLLILAAVLKQPALLLISLLFFFTSGLARLWSAYCLKHLELNLSVSEDRVFSGDDIILEVSLTNSKFLPLPWVNLEVGVPLDVKLLKGRANNVFGFDRNALSVFLSLSWYHRIKRRYPVHCGKRGLFVFGPTRITSGDPFGFFRTSIDIEKEIPFLVYPRVLTLQELGIPSLQSIGDIRIKRHLFTDPIQVMSVRDYQHGDPHRYIHWKATARWQKLQSRVFDYTTTVDMALFVDTRTAAYRFYWGSGLNELLETTILAAAAIAADSLRQGYKVGLYSNVYYWNSDRMIKLQPSDHPDQLKNILEGLAHLRGFPLTTIDRIMSREASQISWQTTLVLITPVLTDENISVLQHLKKAGRQVVLILIGKDTPFISLPGITVYKVSDEIGRGQATNVTLKKII